jgi:beta-mannosidase
LKANDPARYLDYGRAAVAEAIEATLCEWRCKHSSNAGALVWFWKDLWASTGWGVIDWRGRPKSAWHGMRRALQPVQLVLTDEGVNGAHLHCINERATPFSGRVELLCYRDGATVVMQAERAIEIAPRDILLLRDSALIGGFFDTTYAYRFGPPSHQAVLARLWNNEGALVSSAWLFPLGRAAALYQPTLTCEIIEEDGLALRLSTDVLAQSVRIEDERATPAENWVHLAPGAPRVIRFFGAPQSLKGRIAALGGAPVFYNSEG